MPTTRVKPGSHQEGEAVDRLEAFEGFDALPEPMQALFLSQSQGAPLWARQQLNHSDLDRLYGYAYHLYESGAYAGAKEILFLLVSLALFTFDYHLSLGLCWQKLDRHADALFSFMIAGALKPTDPRPLYFSADSYEALGEPEVAQGCLRDVQKLLPGFPDMQSISAAVERRLKAGQSHHEEAKR